MQDYVISWDRYEHRLRSCAGKYSEWPYVWDILFFCVYSQVWTHQCKEEFYKGVSASKYCSAGRLQPGGIEIYINTDVPCYYSFISIHVHPLVKLHVLCLTFNRKGEVAFSGVHIRKKPGEQTLVYTRHCNFTLASKVPNVCLFS